MGVDIKKFSHSDKRLWPILGPLVCDREIHKELGGPIYSSDETTWFIALKDGETAGFAAVRDSNAGYWIDYTWVKRSLRGKGIHKKLAAEYEAFIKSLPEKPVLVCCQSERWKHYKERGFKKSRQRGNWVYGEKGTNKK